MVAAAVAKAAWACPIVVGHHAALRAAAGMELEPGTFDVETVENVVDAVVLGDLVSAFVLEYCR